MTADELRSALQLAAWGAGFQLAWACFRRAPGAARDAGRFALGLALGALACRVGGAALDPGLWRGEPWRLLDPTRAVSVLFLPFGVLATLPWRGGAARRSAYAAAAAHALPLALAVARLGCLARGCCHGRAALRALPLAGLEAQPVPLAVGVPVPLYEAGALALLAAGLRRVRPGAAPAVALVGVALARLATDPLRTAPLPNAARLLLAVQLAAGLALGARARRERLRVLSPRRSRGARRDGCF